MTRRAAQSRPFLPESLAGFLRRSAVRVGGLAVLASAALMAWAVAGYRPGDPSFDAASSGPVLNPLGRAGADFADLALQHLGAVAAAPLLALAAWGLGWVVLRTPARPALRGLALLISLPLLACPLAWLPGLGIDLPAGWGGALGAVLRLKLAALGGLPHWAEATLAWAVGLPTGLALLAYGAGVPARVWLALAAALAWLVRHLRRRPAAPAPRRARTPRRREAAVAEPTLGGLAEPGLDEDIAGTDDEPVPTIDRASAAAPARPAEAARARQGSLPLMRREAGHYELPPLDLLALPKGSGVPKTSDDGLTQNARLLESVLAEFGVNGAIVHIRPGPVVTLYELEPAPGTKTSRVVGLADDIARSMSAVSARIAVIPGRNVIGIELPNARRETVFLRELLASDAFAKAQAPLTLALGKNIGGGAEYVDLARMPHLLIAGTTGSGKSVAINTMILSLLYRLRPERCRLIMIDPKMLELSVYDGIPHLLAPVVTDPGKAVVALKWAVREMEDRYRAMSQVGVRNVQGYNAKLAQTAEKGETLTRTVQTGFDPESGDPVFEEQTLDLKPLPSIVVVVDEMADLMMVAGKDVEAAIQRLAQMARAAGIHLIMATQRPSVDVITGTIKANFPTRISFQVTSKIDSRTILGEQGAEQLLGQGDMLYMAAGGRITRIHGPFVSDEEVEAVAGFLREQGEPEYVADVTVDPDGEGDDDSALNDAEVDPLYDQAVSIVLRERKASTSFIQRQLQIGYNRAARIVEAMERAGLVSPANHVGKREVLGGES